MFSDFCAHVAGAYYKVWASEIHLFIDVIQKNFLAFILFKK